MDEGISGNRILNDSVCFGVNAQARSTRDVAARAGARYVVLLEGINDIGFSQTPNSGCTAPNTNVSASQIIAGYRHIIAAAHAAGLKIFGGTLTPFQGAGYYSEDALVLFCTHGAGGLGWARSVQGIVPTTLAAISVRSAGSQSRTVPAWVKAIRAVIAAGPGAAT